MLSVAAAAHAQEAPTRAVAQAIEIDASDCLVHGRLAAHVETWLGRPQIDSRVGVRVRDLRKAGGGVVFEVLREGTPVAERRLEPRAIPCGDLTAALGLAIALSIDATFLQSMMPGLQLAAPPAAPGVHPKPPAPAPPPRPPREAPATPLYGMAQAHGLIGVAPVPVLGGAFGVELGLAPPFSLRLGALGTANHSLSLGRGTADVGIAAGRADGCLSTPVDALSVSVCAGVVAGRWVARGHGFDVDRATTIPWAAGVARFEGRVEVARRVYVLFSLDGYVPFYRPQLDVTDGRGGTVTSSQAPATGLGVGVGPAIRFM